MQKNETLGRISALLMKGDVEAVKQTLRAIDPHIFENNPRFTVELDLISFTSLLRRKQLEPAILLAQEKLLPVLDSGCRELGLGQKIKVG